MTLHVDLAEKFKGLNDEVRISVVARGRLGGVTAAQNL